MQPLQGAFAEAQVGGKRRWHRLKAVLSVAPTCFRYTLKLVVLICLLSQGPEDVPREGKGEMLGSFPLYEYIRKLPS